MDLQETIVKSKNIIFNCLIVLLAVFISFKIYNSQLAVIKSLNDKKENELKKNDFFKNISKVEKRFISYSDYLNNKEISTVINNLGLIAKESGVEIVSISPDREEDQSLLKIYPYKIKLRADSFHKLGEFIARIESHKDVYALDIVTVDAGSRAGNTINDILNVTLELSTFLVRK